MKKKAQKPHKPRKKPLSLSAQIEKAQHKAVADILKRQKQGFRLVGPELELLRRMSLDEQQKEFQKQQANEKTLDVTFNIRSAARGKLPTLFLQCCRIMDDPNATATERIDARKIVMELSDWKHVDEELEGYFATKADPLKEKVVSISKALPQRMAEEA